MSKTLAELQAERPLIDWLTPLRLWGPKTKRWHYACRICVADGIAIGDPDALPDNEDDVREHISQVHAS